MEGGGYTVLSGSREKYAFSFSWKLTMGKRDIDFGGIFLKHNGCPGLDNAPVSEIIV